MDKESGAIVEGLCLSGVLLFKEQPYNTDINSKLVFVGNNAAERGLAMNWW
jgi:hypothetical protein